MFQFSAFVLVSRNQRLFDNFTGLIAAFHAITLLTPRHPPHALSSLTTMILDSPYPPDLPFYRATGQIPISLESIKHT